MEMVERHYFRGKVIRDYSFKFGFVIPNSTNSWEFVYDLPQLSEEEKAEIEKKRAEIRRLEEEAERERSLERRQKISIVREEYHGEEVKMV